MNNWFLRGLKDGLPIGMGYFAVAFSLGIVAHNVGLSEIQGFFMSLLNHASAGEYAGLSAMKDNATYISVAFLILVANARYLLMGCSLSQKLSPDLKMRHRLLIGFEVTDEIFGLAISRPGFIKPEYLYGAFFTTIPLWAVGTTVGIFAGNVLPQPVVVALSASIYGMFIAIMAPASRKDNAIFLTVILASGASILFSVIPGLSGISEGIRIIILTILIASIVAVIKPVKDEAPHAAEEADDNSDSEMPEEVPESEMPEEKAESEMSEEKPESEMSEKKSESEESGNDPGDGEKPEHDGLENDKKGEER